MNRKRVLSVRLDEELWQAFRDLAGQRGLRVSHLLRGLIRRTVRDDEFAEFDTTEGEFDRAFYEDDEPVADVVAAFERGMKLTTHDELAIITPSNRTYHWQCEHLTISGPISTAPASWCGCELRQGSS